MHRLSIGQKKTRQQISLDYVKRHPIKRKRTLQKYYKENKQILLEKRHDHYLKNKQKSLEYQRKWRKENPELYKKQMERMMEKPDFKIKNQEHNRKIKIECLMHYGLVCQCCGEENFEFLTIHHKNKNGAEHRKKLGMNGGMRFYYWLKRNNFPRGYETLCFNCNQAEGNNFNMICPHKLLDCSDDL